MARGDIGIGLLAAAAGWHDYHTLMQKLDLLEDEVKKHRVVFLHKDAWQNPASEFRWHQNT